MLDLLELIAAQLGIPFCYGATSDLNISADKLASGKLLFHEGYVGGESVRDVEGYWNNVFELRLWILHSSDLADVPTTHRNRFADLYQVKDQILRLLQETEGVTLPDRVRIEEGVKLNATDRVLDGIRVYGSITVEAKTLC